MGIKVKTWSFKYGGLKYFRGNAHLLEMGSYGKKKDPVGAKAFLNPQNKVKRDCLVNRIKKGKPVDIDWAQTNEADVEANGSLQAFGLDANAATSFSYSKTKKAKLKLFNLSIDEGPLKSMLNNDANGARKYLADEGKDGRIISEVWVVMEADLAEHFDTSASIMVSSKAADLNITAKGGKYGTQNIQLSNGTTFAYKLHKIKKWNKGKTKIEDMTADYKT